MAMGLGAFTEGLQGGIAARDKMDMNRQYKKLLAMKAHESEMGISGRNDQLEALGMDRMDFMPDKDPALIRFGGWLKNKMGFGGETPMASSAGGISEDPKLEKMQNTLGDVNPDQLNSGIQNARDGGRIRRMANGGPVDDDWDDEILAGAAGAYGIANRSKVAGLASATGRGLRTAAGSKLARGGAGLAAVGAMQGAAEAGGTDTDVYRERLNMRRDRGGSVDEAMQAADELYYGYKPGERELRDKVRSQGYEVYDREKRDYVGDMWSPRNMLGFVKDVLSGGESGGDVVARTAGTLGEVGDKVSLGLTDSSGGLPERAAPADAPAGAGAATEATTPAPDKSDEEIAQQAIATGEEAAAENFDYRMLPADTRPEDMPSMSTQDWVVNRRLMMQGLIKQGKDPSEALKIVDDITVGHQMRGMQRELQKAMTYMEMGDLRAAGFAIRQGFQYFPNGVDVRLAIQTGPNGQQALVAMGTDEETGEPTGQPMIISSQRLAALAENFSNPAAFRTWTKDGQELQLEIAKLKDLSAYRQDSLDIQRANAITNRMDAAGGGGGGGLKPSDVDRRSADIVEALDRQAFGERLPEGVTEDLASVGELIMQMRPNWGAQQIAKSLRDAWTGQPGGEAGVIELLESLRGE